MKSLGRREALLALGVTLAGCTPEQKAVTQSNVAAGSQRKLGRVVIAISVGAQQLTPAQNASLLQIPELRRAFEAKWPALGISVEVVDAEQAAASNASFRANQVLTLSQGRGKIRGGFVEDYEIGANLYDAAARKTVWRATTELPDFWRASHTASARPAAADRYVDSLTAKLREDGFI